MNKYRTLISVALLVALLPVVAYFFCDVSFELSLTVIAVGGVIYGVHQLIGFVRIKTWLGRFDLPAKFSNAKDWLRAKGFRMKKILLTIGAVMALAISILAIGLENTLATTITGTLLYAVMNKWYRRPGMKGWHFNFLTWEIARAVVCLVVGGLFAGSLKLVFQLLPLYDPLHWYVLVPLAGFVSFMFWKPETVEGQTTEVFVVPEVKKAAYMLWFGMSLNLYFWTSNYSGLKELGLRASTKVSLPFTDEAGFVNMGEVQFTVWDIRDAKEGTPARTIISAPAKNKAEIFGQMLFVLRPVDPIKALNMTDAAMDLGERARQEFRQLTELIVDTDIPSLSADLDKIFTGSTIVTCFVGNKARGHKTGAMIRDEAGKVMYTLVENGATLEETAIKLLQKMREEADLEMLQAVAKKGKKGSNGKKRVDIRFDFLTVRHPIKELLDAIGYRLERVAFSDLDFSAPVKAAAAAASAEQDERSGQLQSASTIKAVRQELLPSREELENPAFELTMIIAAAQDSKNGNIRAIWTPSGNKLNTAAIVAASEARGNP